MDEIENLFIECSKKKISQYFMCNGAPGVYQFASYWKTIGWLYVRFRYDVMFFKTSFSIYCNISI